MEGLESRISSRSDVVLENRRNSSKTKETLFGENYFEKNVLMGKCKFNLGPKSYMSYRYHFMTLNGLKFSLK